MLTREFGKRCSISGFRCKPWSAKPRGPGQPADRVASISSRLHLLWPSVVSRHRRHSPIHGPVGSFGLFFLGAGDELFLSTAGAGQPFSNFDVSDLAGRLQRVLVAMTADPTRPLSSMDVLDAGEHARLDEIGNRAVLTQPATRRCRFRCCSPRRWPAPRRRWR